MIWYQVKNGTVPNLEYTTRMWVVPVSAVAGIITLKTLYVGVQPVPVPWKASGKTFSVLGLKTPSWSKSIKTFTPLWVLKGTPHPEPEQRWPTICIEYIWPRSTIAVCWLLFGLPSLGLLFPKVWSLYPLHGKILFPVEFGLVISVPPLGITGDQEKGAAMFPEPNKNLLITSALILLVAPDVP